jgi:hypothetical protein
MPRNSIRPIWPSRTDAWTDPIAGGQAGHDYPALLAARAPFVLFPPIGETVLIRTEE